MNAIQQLVQLSSMLECTRVETCASIIVLILSMSACAFMFLMVSTSAIYILWKEWKPTTPTSTAIDSIVPRTRSKARDSSAILSLHENSPHIKVRKIQLYELCVSCVQVDGIGFSSLKSSFPRGFGHHVLSQICIHAQLFSRMHIDPKTFSSSYI